MRPLIAAGVMLIIAGCVSTAHEPASYAPQSGADSDVQTRARLHTELAAGYLELGNYGVALQEANEALKYIGETGSSDVWRKTIEDIKTKVGDVDTALAMAGLVASSVTRNTTWLDSVMRVAFSVITGDRITP